MKKILPSLFLTFCVSFSQAQSVYQNLKNCKVKQSEYDFGSEAMAQRAKLNDKGYYQYRFKKTMSSDSIFLVLPKSNAGEWHFGYGNSEIPFETYVGSKYKYEISPLDLYSSLKIDTTRVGFYCKEKAKFTLKSTVVPVFMLNNFKKMSFEDRLVILAFSAQYYYQNLLISKTEERKTAYDHLSDEGDDILDNGILVNGFYSTRSMVSMSAITQILTKGKENNYTDKKNAFKAAKEYTQKVRAAFKSLEIKETITDDETNNSYRAVFVLESASDAVFFCDEKVKNVFRVIVTAEEDADNKGKFMAKLTVVFNTDAY